MSPFVRPTGWYRVVPSQCLFCLPWSLVGMNTCRHLFPASFPSRMPMTFLLAQKALALARYARRSLLSIRAHTHQFVTRSGLKINGVKSFTFGHNSLKGSLPSVLGHKQSFRLTGGTVKLSPEPCWSQLEKEKEAKWSASVANIRRLPVGWFTKVTWLQRVSPQLTWAQGTHRLALSKDHARTLRAKVVRALLDVDDFIPHRHMYSSPCWRPPLLSLSVP